VEYLLTTGAEIIGWWDPVDGLTFPVEGHEKRFRQASSGHGMRAAEPEAAAAEPGAVDPDPAEQETAEPDTGAMPLSRRRAQKEERSATVASQPGNRRIMSVHDVLGSVRRVAAREDVASAFVLQDIDAVLQPGCRPGSARRTRG